jgi:uncharacterized membrane protein YhfC
LVSTLSLAFMLVSILLSFGLPIGLVIYFYIKKRISLLAVLVGVLGFLVTQVLIRIPALGWLSQSEFYRIMAATPAVLVLFLSLTAGLFEETGRWLAFRFLLRKKLEHKNAVAYGIGHGGFEAIILVGFTFINNLVYSLMINNGTFDSILAPQLGPDMANYVRSQLVDLPATMFLAGGIERVFTIVIQIALSVMVYLGVRQRRVGYYWMAVLAHTAVNFVAVMITTTGVSVWFAELTVFVFALVGLWFIGWAKKQDEKYVNTPETAKTVDS